MAASLDPVSKKCRTMQSRSGSRQPNRPSYVPRIFALLTDTSSCLSNFQPAAWEDRSQRLLNLPTLGLNQFDLIFTFTSIDAHSIYSNRSCTADIDLVADSERLLKFGRAGWHSVGGNLKMDPVAFAMVKLAGGTQQLHKFFETQPEKLMSPKTRIALHAILAPRLAVMNRIT
jgi:hypothetical protein